MRVIEKIEVSKLKYGCVVVTQNFLFNYSLFKIILNPSKKVEFSSENQKDMSVDGTLLLLSIAAGLCKFITAKNKSSLGDFVATKQRATPRNKMTSWKQKPQSNGRNRQIAAF